MKIVATGLSYKNAPVEVRERVAVPADKLRCAGCRLKVAGGLSEAVVVSTCNRVEIYGVTTNGHWRPEVLFNHPVAADTLVVEGWVDDETFAAAATEFATGRYRQLLGAAPLRRWP